jgi:hypothetical protein
MTASWIAANQALLTGMFDAIHRRLAVALNQPPPAGPPADLAALRAAMPSPSALEVLAKLFALDPFASDLVLLCAGAELDGRIAAQVAALDGPGSLGMPSVAAVFRALDGAHWSAFAPDAPLRRARIAELSGEGRFTAQTLRLDERVLHYLLGVPALDARLSPLLAAIEPGEGPDAAVTAVVAALARPAPLLLTGRDTPALGAVLATAAARLGGAAMRLDPTDLPAGASEREMLAALLRRETLLSGMVPAIFAEDADEATLRTLPALLARLGGRVAVLARGPVQLGGLVATRLAVDAPDAQERAAILRQALGASRQARAATDAVAAQFVLSASALRAVAAQAAARPRGVALRDALWHAAREEARLRFDGLAERIETRAGWDDLILPPARKAILRQIETQLAERMRVYEHWGFRERLSERGLGITALFAGPSGVGKTLAGEVIAHALKLDLHRIDLSAVVSKYIGETEKNLRRVFDAAEASGAVLLLDEADALLGKRSEVKDSHDRYANIEVSYLLQRMESYTGLAILTTNMKQNIDNAFLRRIRFVVDFPFPTVEEREAIWTRVFPRRLPREALDPRRLAQMNLAGGAIRNVALNAAFLAAADGGVVRSAHVLAAARSEYAKLEKPLTEGELRGWGQMSS